MDDDLEIEALLRNENDTEMEIHEVRQYFEFNKPVRWYM